MEQPEGPAGRDDPPPQGRSHDGLLRFWHSVSRCRQDEILGQASARQLLDRKRQRRVERGGSALPHGRQAYAAAKLAASAGRERRNLFRCDRTLDTRQYASWKHQSCPLARGSRQQEGANSRVRSGRRSTLNVAALRLESLTHDRRTTLGKRPVLVPAA